MKLPKAFFRQNTLALARQLLGKHLVRRWRGHVLRGRVVEVEAYHQDGDRASHSFRGPTRRNAVMFGPPGHLYVYFIYGVHHCLNVVTEPRGIGAAVLIRALEPLEGLEQMRCRRGPCHPDRQLMNGPGKLCQALAVGRAENGLCLTGDRLFFEEGENFSDQEIAAGPRIGISKSKELPWRFYLKGNLHVSRG